jgi:predicted ATPase/DNA-binding XRE family transcriptional regulator
MHSAANFSELLRHLRKRAGLTQGELAAAAGCSVSYISALETGQRRPDVEMVRTQLAPALAGDERLLDRLLELATPVAAIDRGEPVHALPPGRLLGRDAEIALVSARLASHPGRLLTLTGPPGIGKTRLALAIAETVAPFYADGVCVAWLGAVESVELVAPALASAFGLVESSQPPTARLIAHLRRKELLLVIDNFEQVMAAAPLVADMLAACPRLRILVTSRERLRLRAEQSMAVRPLDDATAIDLFITCVRGQDADYNPSPTERNVVAAICRLLDNLPLAIELIAAHASTQSPTALLAHLRDRQLDRLSFSYDAPSADQRSLTTALQRSYDLLLAEEQRLFRMLGLFVGGASLDALTWLGFDMRAVQSLVNKSLLRLESAGGDRRATMLETVRDFALCRLQEMGEMDAAQKARLAWCAALAKQAASQLQSAMQTEWLHRLEPDRFNFYGALRFALTADASAVLDAVQLVVGLRHFWVARSHLAEIAHWLDAIHAAAEDIEIDAALWVRLLNCEGTIAFYQEAYAAANAHFNAALARAEALNDREGMAYALDGLGAEAANRGDLPAARACSIASLEHSTAIGDHWLAGITRMNLGEIARMEGDIAAAAAHYLACLGQLQLIGDPYFIAVGEINLGQVYVHQGDLLRAETALRRALASGLQAESAQVVAAALEKLAGVLCDRNITGAGRLFSLAQGVRQASGVTVQPVDRQDYARLAEQLQSVLEPENVMNPIAEEGRINWRAIQTSAQAILEQKTS